MYMKLKIADKVATKQISVEYPIPHARKYVVWEFEHMLPSISESPYEVILLLINEMDYWYLYQLFVIDD